MHAENPKQTKNIHISGNDTNALVSFMQVCLCKFSILSKKKNEAKIKNSLENVASLIYLFIYLKSPNQGNNYVLQRMLCTEVYISSDSLCSRSL